MQEPLDILIVDDDPRNLDALEAILADPSYRLIRALNGDDALRALLRHDVAVIVLDIQMPGVSGFELAQLIRSNKRYERIPILFLTAYMMDERDVIAGYGAGAADYLTKPINAAILRHKIAFFTDLYSKTRALNELNETLETRVRERTAELERSELALRTAARQKDEFLATLAHELRNPLAPLRMGLDLLLRKGSDDNRRTLAAMNRQLDHMVRLIDDLLDVARISGGKLDLRKERISVHACVLTALDTCRPSIEQRQQAVSTELDPSLFCFADATRLTQIVGNLLHNASKFTPEGGKIQVQAVREAESAVIRVIDEGVGIAPEQLPRVFEMFTRVEGTSGSGSGGLGIGLALSRRLAEMHDGELTAESAGLGHGSVFTLKLAAESAELGARRASVPPPAPPAPRRRVSVLIVEDNSDSAEVLSQALESRGYPAAVASTGPEGLRLFEQQKPRVVLCDIGLPGMSGTEVCERVRQLPLDYRPVMVALTGWGMKEDREKTRASGFDHHLVKPVAPDALFAILDQVPETVDGPSA